MTQANIELLKALKSAGADEALAEAAARSPMAVGEVATKADLARLETRVLAYLMPVYMLLAYLAIRLA